MSSYELICHLVWNLLLYPIHMLAVTVSPGYAEPNPDTTKFMYHAQQLDSLAHLLSHRIGKGLGASVQVGLSHAWPPLIVQ